MPTQSGRTSILNDPALMAMGLVPTGSGGPAGRSDSAVSWRTAWGALVLGLAAILVLFRPTVEQAVSVWYHSASFNHAFLIFPICGYLIWDKRAALARTVPSPSWWGLAVIALAGFAWLIGHLGSAVMVQQFAVVIMIQGMFLAVFGRRIVWLLVFPLAYMFFAVPVGLFLIPPLQDLTAVFVVKGLQMVGIPVFLDGIFLSIPTGNFEVAEACSGVRFLIATTALGMLFAHLTYRSPWRRIIFVALSFVVPVIANGFRAFGIVMLAYVSNNEIAVGVDHIIYGWVFFAFVTIVLLLIGMTFRDGEIGEPAADTDVTDRPAAPPANRRRIGIVALVSILASAVAPAYAGHVSARPIPSVPDVLPAPEAHDGWKVTGTVLKSGAPHYPAAHARLLRQYAKGSKRVDLFIAYYAAQRQGAELISNGNVVSPTWSRAASGRRSVLVDGVGVSVDRMRMIYGGRYKRIVYRWYWVGGAITASPYVAKFLQAKDQLLAGNEAAAVVIVSAPYDEHENEADRAIEEFLSDVQPISPLLQRFAHRD